MLLTCYKRPMFFPHLRDLELDASKEIVKELRNKYDLWSTTSSNYRACISNGMSSDPGRTSHNELMSLELCAGEQGMSRALQRVGFQTTTLDNDPKRAATSMLSLAELEGRIVTGQITNHPHLNKSFSVVWAAPECRTWSKAQSGSYRNMEFIDGFRGTALEPQAQQARRDIESLINILSFYQARNTSLIMVIENPVGCELLPQLLPFACDHLCNHNIFCLVLIISM